MKKSKVYFHNGRASVRKNRLDKLRELLGKGEFSTLIEPGDKVAIKVHWGEPGNVGYIPVPYVRTIVEWVTQASADPFVTDTNTLYAGMRRDAISNIRAAAMNGYCMESLTAPVIVADGLKGFDGRDVRLPGLPSKSAKIASGILDADAMIVISHVKGHMLFGFGGAIKNLGMGCTPPAGKQFLHSGLRPKVLSAKCRGDGLCVERCPTECISLVERNPKPNGASLMTAVLDSKECIGCGECTGACPHDAIPIRWETSADDIMHKTAEYALAAVSGKREKVAYINLLLNITPDCDCCHWNDPAFVPDVGMAASLDPLAIDVASADLVCKTEPCVGSLAHSFDGDPWRAKYDVDYREVFSYGERIGLGSQSYDLVALSKPIF
jgi:uncharacterized Fe-S center protein